MSTKNLLGKRVRFYRKHYHDRSCPRSLRYSILLPDIDGLPVFADDEGLKITEVGESDDILTAVRLETGNCVLVEQDWAIVAGKVSNNGEYYVTTSDNPRVQWAMWHSAKMPVPVRKSGRGRMTWKIPDIGTTRLYYNEKKEDMDYRPDSMHTEDHEQFIAQFGGLPIMLEEVPNTPFTPNYFLCENRLYDLGNPTSKFVRELLRIHPITWKFLGSFYEEEDEDGEDLAIVNLDVMFKKVSLVERLVWGIQNFSFKLLSGNTNKKWNREIKTEDVLSRADLLAEAMGLPVRIVVYENQKYVWKGPFVPST